MLPVIRIVFVEDHVLLRQALCRMLERGGRVLVVAQAGSAEEGLELVHRAADLFLVDLNLPDRDGLWLIRELRKVKPDLPVLVFSHYLEEAVVRACLDAGATGYVPKSCSKEDLQDAIARAASGERYVHQSIQLSVRPGRPELTPIEQKLVEMLATGQTLKRISQDLDLPLSRVKAYLTPLYRKLEVRDRTQAVLAAYRSGWLREQATTSQS
ncbi:MAG: response regulator transcription factor [Candidatus Eremiobacterota bacterium]